MPEVRIPIPLRSSGREEVAGWIAKVSVDTFINAVQSIDTPSSATSPSKRRMRPARFRVCGTGFTECLHSPFCRELKALSFMDEVRSS
jgi:hypothetical protein